ncbi:Lipopolysaccharide-induced tumor necrosis factor-alpha factor isoform 2 [Schistosoma japonicum]|uniref:Lipopolysaccharide-induced tumor necrosis factor-alpha factor isoform 2 n=1 Tax=Schistosoma japonicum TaxID=6182 RepID=Q5DEA8_SCHJA|nr:SJCHGC01333 protein [Schistosoma japonicum]TNN18333.1 Lipopolysaccharide-induced tumor necrosis factor-alpha factor isoform 2 [Schistosoma japonicum]
MDRKSSDSKGLSQSRKPSETSIIEQLAQNQKTFPKTFGRSSISSEKRRYSAQTASTSGAIPPRNSPRATPYVNAPITTGLTPVSPAIPRASIACIPMSVQAQLQQNQTVRSDQPSIAKPSTQPPLGRSFVAPSITPKVSLDKIPESENESTMKLGRSPKSFRCECCQHVTVTRTTYQVGALTWIMAVVIFLCGGILGCFLIPFLVDCCKDVRHECPFCGTEIGVVKCI